MDACVWLGYIASCLIGREVYECMCMVRLYSQVIHIFLVMVGLLLSAVAVVICVY